MGDELNEGDSGTAAPPTMEQLLWQMMMQMASMNASNTVPNTVELDAEVREFLGDKYVNPSSPAGKLISEFNDCTKPIKKSVPLTRAATYPGWREHIFHTIKILEIEDIILLKQKKSPKENATVTALWKHHNI